MLTPILVIISLNIGLFIAVQISPENISGVHQLAIDLALYSPAEVFFKQPWGIVTSMFVHDGFFHLFANMITLFFFGNYLNRLIGSKKLLLVYFSGGILGNIFFVLLGTLLNPDSLALAVGASGAVFALGGALAVMQPNLRVFIFPIPAPIPLWIAVIGGFVILSFLPYIAWEAHLGGLLFGLIAGYLFKRRRRYYY
jgi:membrane associated rhomboid family serine protease